MCPLRLGVCSVRFPYAGTQLVHVFRQKERTAFDFGIAVHEFAQFEAVQQDALEPQFKRHNFTLRIVDKDGVVTLRAID